MANYRRRKTRDQWGSVTYDSKRKVGVIRYWASTDERGYMRHSKSVRGTRQEVEEERARLMLLHGKERPCPTVRQAWEEWCLPDLQKHVDDGDMAPLTKRAYETGWKLDVGPRWAETPVDQVRPLQIQQWISTMGYTKAERAVMVLTRILDYATRYEVIPHNPMREKYVMPSKSTIERLEKGVWKLEELEGVWKRIYGLWWEPAFLLAAFGGCRLGESMSPLAKDVEVRDVDGITVAVVPITGQLASAGTSIVKCKTASSVRSVVLVGKPAERLAEIAASMPSEWPLCNDGFGNRYPQARLKDAWRHMRMEHQYRNLRNGWQTYMRWELGVAPFYIESMMGHKVAGVTGQHYDRPNADQFVNVMLEAYRKKMFDAEWKVGQ